jgi:hypothetical protein
MEEVVEELALRLPAPWGEEGGFVGRWSGSEVEERRREDDTTPRARRM